MHHIVKILTYIVLFSHYHFDSQTVFENNILEIQNNTYMGGMKNKSKYFTFSTFLISSDFYYEIMIGDTEDVRVF